MDAIKLGPFSKGMNNIVKDSAVPNNAARNIVNGDIDSEGIISRRDGQLKVYSGINPKGGFSCPLGMFFVEGGYLKSWNGGASATSLCGSIYGTTPCYLYLNGIVYFSDGLVSKKIIDGVVKDWGMLPPNPPVLSSTAGTFGAGVYLAACSFVDSDGLESGASEIVSISVDDDSGIVFNYLPLITGNASYLRIYLSTPNGKILYHVADVTSDSYTVTAGRYDSGNILALQHISPAPAGKIIRFYNGRIYIVDANGNVWESEPFSYDHFRISSSYNSFPNDISIMEPVKNGIFFADNKETWFYEGNTEDGFNIRSVLDYGAVYGTGKTDPITGNPVWQSQRGMVEGFQDGTCKNKQNHSVAVESAVSGASLIREQNGIRQFIVSLHEPTVSSLASKSWIEAEVIRRGA